VGGNIPNRTLKRIRPAVTGLPVRATKTFLGNPVNRTANGRGKGKIESGTSGRLRFEPVSARGKGRQKGGSREGNSRKGKIQEKCRLFTPLKGGKWARGLQKRKGKRVKVGGYGTQKPGREEMEFNSPGCRRGSH